MNAPLVCPLAPPECLDVLSQNVTLAAYLWRKADAPTLLFVHGYPDNHRVWLPVISQLAQDFQILAYDVRGSGASEAPARIRDYRLPLLANDLEAVIEASKVTTPVHLIAHDWGSIQSWEAVTEPRIAAKLASYTSISGPCLDHVGHWMRQRVSSLQPKALAQVVGQLLSSWYIALFQLPWIPELCWKLGTDRLWPSLLDKLEGVKRAPINPTQLSDGQVGVRLYRANFFPCLGKPRQRHTQVPVQLIVPTHDRFVRPQLFAELDQWVSHLERHEVAAGHWQLLHQPAQLAQWIKSWALRYS